MIVNVATVLAALIGAGILFIAVNAVRAPRTVTGFGIPGTPVDDPAFRAWISVKAARDAALGVVLFVLLAVATPAVLGWFLLVTAGIPVGDMLIVLRSKGPRAIAYGVHGATAAVMLVAGVLLLVG
ncbi:hypothetical protein GCM10010168_17560 [Actinoplanes ianthinogenes]|uniref:DUF4267 domain-containing protein n=1 Tax=Actinoplanes ianthinogenes TaxID=122358 RepID=A0ABM7M738_9ACTN|nr:DUF4267 domain-containing protein [Actinoplanes ianthinogenes]BCJ47398.1 hypothetical protein Aiant_80550 [Actinoplanes ianthinogenes]GGR01538.1 hypothetical protein GCM10010168_17560 [Actinoplanes ianthinogenes]